MKKLNFILAALVLSIAGVVSAQETETPNPLDVLLEQTREAARVTRGIDAAREAEFINERNQQRQLLARARAELRSEEQRSDQLKTAFDTNERTLADLETVLNERMGNLGEMFGVVRQVANDLKGKIDNSIVSAQFPGRHTFLSNLASRKELPTIPELRNLWFELQQELTEQSKIISFVGDILRPTGKIDRNQQITRIGVFNAMSDGKFLQWRAPSNDHKNGILAELTRQPPARFTGLVAAYESAIQGEPVPMAVDFTRGVILSLVVQTKTWPERLGIGTGDYGDAGFIGWVIIVVGMIGLIMSIFRGLMLSLKGMAIRAQLKKKTPDNNNALGRVMAVYTENPHADVETLELKLDEAILRETGPLEAGLAFIKMIYVIAPLMGLLGTVVGMIGTFQAITLYGTGDPKMMAGGISMALVTTVLGLVVAIPLTFLHSVLMARSKASIQVLEEQSAGIIARLAEKQDGMAV
jgi:biopolymer transport protein ExbB